LEEFIVWETKEQLKKQKGAEEIKV